MNTRITIPLLVLFFAGLLALWWADWSGITTEADRRRMSGRVLPELLDTEIADIHRLVIHEGEQRIVLQRRDQQRWQLVEPIDALADASQVEVLLRNLKGLRRLEEAGTIEGDEQQYGFDPPTRTVMLYGSDSEEPLASLEIGGELEDQRFVRPVGRRGIELADAARLEPALLSADDWRERSLFDVYSYDISSLDVQGPERSLRVVLDKGRWRIEAPIRAPADSGAINGLMADLATLEAVAGERGFVANDVQDFSPYGLDRPAFTITLTPGLAIRDRPTGPQVAHIGDRLEDAEEPTYYARREGEDDVLLVRSRTLADLGTDPNLVRSRRVADFDPGAVAFIEVQADDVQHLLSRGPDGWQVVRPEPGPVELQSVGELLSALNNLQSAEFLSTEQGKQPGFDPPAAVFRVWLSEGSGESSAQVEPRTEPEGEPEVELQLGRYDASSRTVFARTGGDDRTLLTLPASARDLIPKGPLAYRDRTLNETNPDRIGRVVLQRDGRAFVLERSGAQAPWQLIEPSEAPADSTTLRLLTNFLARLRADRLVTEKPEDLSTYGLDEPTIRVSWSAGSSDEPLTLEVGDPVPDANGSRFARLSGLPMVFTIGPEALAILNAEPRERQLLAFPAARADRVTLRWPGDRLQEFRRTETTPLPGVAPGWRPVEGGSAPEIDPARIAAIVNTMANLTALRFTQYEGTFAPEMGLDDPRLTIEVGLRDMDETALLRIGAPADEGLVHAAIGSENAGPVALLPASIFVVEAPDRSPKIPADPFAR
ncbi:hypothetical protein BH23PLA1_BH23PLA1_30510 [soil metagenome]